MISKITDNKSTDLYNTHFSFKSIIYNLFQNLKTRLCFVLHKQEQFPNHNTKMQYCHYLFVIHKSNYHNQRLHSMSILDYTPRTLSLFQINNIVHTNNLLSQFNDYILFAFQNLFLLLIIYFHPNM